MHLEIVSPENVIYSGKADSITLPGSTGSFAILNRHAPIISALDKGVIRYSVEGKESEVITNGGFVETKKNQVSVCIE